jgi:hypothetical protein
VVAPENFPRPGSHGEAAKRSYSAWRLCSFYEPAAAGIFDFEQMAGGRQGTRAHAVFSGGQDTNLAVNRSKKYKLPAVYASARNQDSMPWQGDVALKPAACFRPIREK